MPGKLLAYGDFTCPDGCLASHRIDALKAVGVDIDWRAVELHPELPVMGIPLEGQASTAVDQAMSAVTARLLPGEPLHWKKPAMTPHTQAAVAAFAEAGVTVLTAQPLDDTPAGLRRTIETLARIAR